MNSGFFGFPNILGLLRVTALRAIGKPGATAGVTLAGGTASGPPTSGQFDKGDVVVGQDGSFWVNTAAGSPGQWTQPAGGLAAHQGIAYNYQGIGASPDTTYRIGYGPSADGRRGARALEPAIGPGSGFESAGVKTPCLLEVGGLLYVYYDGYNGSAFATGLATSADGGATFVKSASNPVLDHNSSGWESTGGASVLFPTVLYDTAETDATRRWKMWYGAGTPGGSGGIGYAFSADGVSWTKYSGNPVLTVGSGWESVQILPGAVVRLGGTYYLFYNGNNSALSEQWQGGLATFSDPAGPYTRSASNPLLVSDRLDTTLSTAVAPGDTTVHVADATVFPLGAPVWVVDNTAYYLSYVASRPSSTTLALADAAPAAISTTTAHVRSAAYNSVFIRSALYDGGWVFGCAVFQPQITPGGLKELSMLAYGAGVPPSSATFDYSAGLLVRPTAGETVALNVSLENPSVAALVDTPRRYLAAPAGVTSVALSMPAEFAVAGSPLAGGSGTLSVTKATEVANSVYVGPTAGADAAPTFRALGLADVPYQASSPLVLLPNANSFVVDGTSDEQPPDFVTLANGDVVGVGGM